MSIHINAQRGDIARVVLMPGDPLRAKYIAEKMLDAPKLVSDTRNIYFFTGNYKGRHLSIGGSGMGIPSIGIYSYELYTQYDVECIMRIGTCGAYLTSLKLYDLINVETAYSESTYANAAFGFKEDHFSHQGSAFEFIKEAAADLKFPLQNGPVHSGDAFYTSNEGLPAFAMNNKCLAAEMEAFGLFANAKYCGKMAATLLTVSDIIPARMMISPEERERSLDQMAQLALEAAVRVEDSLDS
jgi:purine-nucleoside phosphorylase